MANIHSLPYEIQRLVFQHVASTKQLGECRLVCKNWDEPAECAMFSRRLHITDSNTKSMYMHLVEKPHRAYLIKEISFHLVQFTEATAMLLRLAITPSIERILRRRKGTYSVSMDPAFYDILISIMKNSKVELHHLKSIPLLNPFTEAQYKAVMLLKGSLEEISITSMNDYHPHPISMHLLEFKCLSTLHVSCTFENLPHAESVFSGAPHLKEIHLSCCYFKELWTNEQSQDWMKQHVEINQNAITIKTIGYRNKSASLIAYFLYKYPNVRHFKHDAAYHKGIETNENICARISKARSYTLTSTSKRGGVAWRDHYRLFTGHKNAFRLYYGRSHPTTINQISSKMEGQERSTQFQLWINCTSEEQFLTFHTNFFNHMGGVITSMTMNFDSFSNYSRTSNVRMPEAKAFFKALQVMNHLENFKLVSSGNLESVDLDLPAQQKDRQLNTLEISGAEIQPKAFHTLDRIFNVIGDLTLSFCSIKKDPTNTTCIHLPSTAVQKIFLTSKVGTGTLQHWKRLALENELKLSQDTYIMINLQPGVTLYFKLTPSCSIVHQVSFVDYFSRPRSAKSFSIYCKLLANLQLDLGEIAATIDVQKYCKSLNAAFNDLRV